ncbi:hypothetical protein Tco_0915547 [Tanacetum coccineum]
MFVKNNANDMILTLKQNEKKCQTIYKDMERKIDEWSKSQTDRTEPPPPPQAHTEQVNAVFTVSGKSDDPLKIQKDPPPPIICTGDLLILELVLDNHYETAVRSRSGDIGDFNAALNMEDSFSCSSRMNSAMCDFKDCIENIDVFDINYFGLHYTWNQKSKGNGGILKKLDRIMGNNEFSDLFPASYALFQPYRISDHSPSVLKIPSLTHSKPKMFRCGFVVYYL